MKVVNFKGVSQVPEVLQKAVEADLSEVVVIGWTKKDGELYMNASCEHNTGEVLHLIEAFKFQLMRAHSD